MFSSTPLALKLATNVEVEKMHQFYVECDTATKVEDVT